MVTQTYLPPQVHAVRIDEDLIFLDVAADSYLCWPRAAGLALSADRRRLVVDDPDTLADLRDAGLVSCTARPQAGPPSLPSASRDLWPDRTTRGERGDGLNLLRAACDGALVYPRRTFAELVAFGAARPAGARPDAEPGHEMARLVAGFHRWVYWTPTPAKCLIRSFVLLRLLRRRGYDARWVFAVRTWPFEAHCWLQAGATVLDDARDRLEAYHPILVV